MSQYLLDTNMLIAAIKGRAPVREKLELIDALVCITVHQIRKSQ